MKDGHRSGGGDRDRSDDHRRTDRAGLESLSIHAQRSGQSSRRGRSRKVSIAHSAMTSPALVCPRLVDGGSGARPAALVSTSSQYTERNPRRALAPALLRSSSRRAIHTGSFGPGAADGYPVRDGGRWGTSCKISERSWLQIPTRASDGRWRRRWRRSGFGSSRRRPASRRLALVRTKAAGGVILEIALGNLSGYEVCHSLRTELGRELPIIFLSGVRTEPYDRVAGLLLGADDYLVKPYADGEIIARLTNLYRHARARRLGEIRRLTKRELEVLDLLAKGCATRTLRASCSSVRRPSRPTSNTSWASSACAAGRRQSRWPTARRSCSRTARRARTRERRRERRQVASNRDAAGPRSAAGEARRRGRPPALNVARGRASPSMPIHSLGEVLAT